MKKIYVVSAGVALVGGTLLALSVSGLGRQPCTAPARPPGVPATAEWAGGCDGGRWVDLQELSDTRGAHVRIFNDFTGELERDAWFRAGNGCVTKPQSRKEFFQRLNFADGVSVHLEDAASSQGHCTLRPD